MFIIVHYFYFKIVTLTFEQNKNWTIKKKETKTIWLYLLIQHLIISFDLLNVPGKGSAPEKVQKCVNP